MGAIHPATPVKFFVGVLSSIPEMMPQVEAHLSRVFGVIDSRSTIYPFENTHYYDKEMGCPIKRCFLGFSALILPDRVAWAKLQTNELEQEFAAENHGVKRPVNLDPGYLELSKVVLASTKNFYHRLYLSDGIYGEATLHYESGAWRSFPWTFPDFRSGCYDVYFLGLRALYREQLKLLQNERERS
jgi:hypothetical protein